MFERAHHRRIATVLESLDAQLLADNRCYFGGGTAIALRYGEYRESKDVDFIVSDVAGYRTLRERLSGRQGINAIARTPLTALREVRADQYGVRTLVDVAGAAIKLEIVLEARITLEIPGASERLCGVTTLTVIDMATTKLLANCDRWADDGVHSRDLIDLAMMRLDKPVLARARAKARTAYGAAVDDALAKSIEALRRRRGRLEECMVALQMTSVPPALPPLPRALVWHHIKRLKPAAPPRKKARRPAARATTTRPDRG